LSGEIIRRFCVLLRDGGDVLVVALNLMNSALPFKILHRFAHFAPRQLLNYLSQFWVFLAHDVFEPYRLHSRVLKRREGPPGLNGLMLPTVADEQHTVICHPRSKGN